MKQEQSPSVALHNAHVDFLADRLALIHIPFKLYGHFWRQLEKILVSTEDLQDRGNSLSDSSSIGDDSNKKTQPPFVNVSITPLECSVVCARRLADKLFVPQRNLLDSALRKQVIINEDDFIVIQVGGEGLEAGQRVVALTHPLALAGICIFFITTYFSDYLLVPQKSYDQVKNVLRDNGFEFDGNESGHMPTQHVRNKSSTSTAGETMSSPCTPPPLSASELQSRTFETLQQRDIRPTLHTNIRLRQCAGAQNNRSRHLGVGGGVSGSTDQHPSTPQPELLLGLVKILIDGPKFLSVTLTDTEQPSILLEEADVAKFPSPDVLLGSKSDVLIPIILDLHNLPLESTGIVWGIASRLVESDDPGMSKPVDMSYLSTARAGTVIVAEAELESALNALNKK